MPSIAVCLLLGLATCMPPTGGDTMVAGPEIAGWRLASGKAPSKAEFAAVVATCEDRGPAPQEAPIEACLAELGLRRAE